MDSPLVSSAGRPGQLFQNTSIQVKLLTMTLGMLGLILLVTIANNLYTLGQFEAQVSLARLNQEYELIETHFAVEESTLKEQATIITLSDDLLAATAAGDRIGIQRLAVQFLARYQLDYMLIMGHDGQILFGNQQVSPTLESNLKLALLTFEQTARIMDQQGAVLTAAVPMKAADRTQGAILIGQVLDNTFLQHINANRTDPILRIYTADAQLLATSAQEDGGAAEARPVDQGIWQRVLAGELVEADELGPDGISRRVRYAWLNQDAQAPVLYSVALSTAEIQTYRTGTIQQSVAILIVIGLLSALLLFFVIRGGIVKPLRRLSEAAALIGAGNLDVQLGPAGQDEIGQLTSSFRTMTEQLRQSMARLEARNQLLQAEMAERRRTEEARVQLQADMLIAQATILEMATPLIPIDERTIVMPIVGALDSQRAQQVLTTLLAGVEVRRAKLAILDITGVPVIDTQAAGAILRVVQAVRMLGAQTVLTGIQPEVAQSMVGLGIDLSSVATYGTLQQAIAAVKR